MPELVEANMKVLKNTADFSGSLAQRVYQSLRVAIMALELPPGTVLRKGAICDELDVSRSPVSEAFTRLSAEGLVDVIPQSVTRVSRFSIPEIKEAAFLREALELATVEKLARDRTDEHLTKLSRNLRLQTLLVEDSDYQGFFQADEEFHEMLMSFTGYPRLADVTKSVTLQINRARMLLLPTLGRAADTVAEHTEIIAAIRTQHPKTARKAMRKHLAQLIARLEPLAHERPDLFRPPRRSK